MVIPPIYIQDLTNLDKVMLDLPYPPSVNTYWRANGKRRFISRAGIEFAKRVAEVVMVSGNPSFGSDRLRVHVVIYPRSKRVMDIDNCLKAILDALMKANVYDDDSQIDLLSVERGEQIKHGGCQVTITHR